MRRFSGKRPDGQPQARNRLVKNMLHFGHAEMPARFVYGSLPIRDKLCRHFPGVDTWQDSSKNNTVKIKQKNEIF